jgi:Uma2 family endonuclease
MTPGVEVPVSSEAVLTAEEYLELPDRGVPTELVRGRVVEMNIPAPRHGEICAAIAILIGPYVRQQALGRVVTNDSGVRTQRGPDTVRGPDVSFYSFARVPPGPLPRGYLNVVPELVFEVRSPTDRWSAITAKAQEYLQAGVAVACVLDEMTETVTVFRDDNPPLTLRGDDELHLPDVLGDFRVPVRRFFE